MASDGASVPSSGNNDVLAVKNNKKSERSSSNSSYRIENNKVVMETDSGTLEEFEIVSSKEKHGTLRKAVPAMPVPLAITCFILNIIPGFGTLVSAFAALCGCPTELQGRCSGFFYNVLVAILQIVFAVFVFGWIWSIQRGVVMIQEAQKLAAEKKTSEKDET